MINTSDGYQLGGTFTSSQGFDLMKIPLVRIEFPKRIFKRSTQTKLLSTQGLTLLFSSNGTHFTLTTRSDNNTCTDLEYNVMRLVFNVEEGLRFLYKNL